MSGLYGIVMTLVDQMSAPLKAVQRSLEAVNATQRAAADVQQSYNSLVMTGTGNLADMRAAVDMLKRERDLIPKTQIESIRAANREVRNLEAEIVKLERLNGGPLKKAMSTLIDVVPGASALMNPIVAASGAATASLGAFMSFDKGMAEVNATAQLSSAGLDGLKGAMKALALEKGVNVVEAVSGLNAMISITNDVALSTRSMAVAADMSKAGFMSMDAAATTLARAMGSIGTTDAAKVADVLFATAREGAVRFSEMADYLPRLIPTAKSLGFSFQEVGGMMAYMTAKGLDAAAAGTLMQNVFTALSKPEIREGLAKYGISLTNADGSAKSMTEVMKSLGATMNGLSLDEQLMVLQEMGFTDAQAREGVRLLTDDLTLLEEKTRAVAGSQSALQSALGMVHNSSNDLAGAWNALQVLMINLGETIIPPISLALQGAAAVTGFLADHSWLLWDALLSVTGAMYGAQITQAALTAGTKVQSAWAAIMAGWNWVWTASNWSVTASLTAIKAAIVSIPVVGWILGGIAALITMWQTWDGFRYALMGVFEVVKVLFKALWQVATLDFSGAAESMADLGGAYERGRNEAIQYDEDKKQAEASSGQAQQQPALTPAAPDPAANLAADMSSISSGVTGGGAKATNITINTLSILETFTLQVQTAAEGADRLRDMVAEEVLRGLNAAVMATGR